MMTNNVPELRFKGFDGEWELSNLESESVRIGSGGTPSKKEKQYWNGDIPWLTTGDISREINTVHDFITKEGLKNSSAKVIEAGSLVIAMYGQGKTRGKVGLLNIESTSNQAVAFVNLKNSNDKYFFLSQLSGRYQEIRKMSNDGGQKNLSLGIIEKIKVSITHDIKEQQAIGSFFEKLDKLIELQGKKVNKLTELKKGYLQKLFTADGAAVPELRFAGFDGEWETKKLGELFDERTTKSKEGELISVTMSSGVVRANSLDRKDNSSSDKSNYKMVKKNDIAYNSMRMWQGASGVSRYDGILSPAYTVLIPKEDSNSMFFAFMFKKNNMLQTFQKYSQGLTSDTWNLKFPSLKTIKVVVPSASEQHKISNFLVNLDDSIEINLEREKVIKDLKKYYLDQLFI